LYFNWDDPAVARDIKEILFFSQHYASMTDLIKPLPLVFDEITSKKLANISQRHFTTP